MLAYYISQIFNNNEVAETFSKNARDHALKTHNIKDNYNNLLKIYKEIGEK